MNTSQIILACLGSASFAGVVGAIVTGFFNRRKLGADATEIITRAASGVVAMLEKERDDLRTEVRELRDEAASWSRTVDSWARVLQLHVAWDLMAATKLRDAGIIDLPDPPPLYPPSPTPGDLKR